MAASPDELRERAEQILDRPEFQEPTPNAVDRVLSWIGDRIGDLFSGLTGGDVGSIAVLVVAGGAIALAIFFVARRLPASPSPVTSGIDVAVRTHRSSAAEWRKLADEAFERGDYDAAVRYEHRHLASRLDDLALIRDRDHRTAAELLTDVRDRPPLAGGMGDLTETFEEVWYGGRSADRRLAEAVRKVSEATRRDAESGS